MATVKAHKRKVGGKTVKVSAHSRAKKAAIAFRKKFPVHLKPPTKTIGESTIDVKKSGNKTVIWGEHYGKPLAQHNKFMKHMKAHKFKIKSSGKGGSRYYEIEHKK